MKITLETTQFGKVLWQVRDDTGSQLLDAGLAGTRIEAAGAVQKSIESYENKPSTLEQFLDATGDPDAAE